MCLSVCARQCVCSYLPKRKKEKKKESPAAFRPVTYCRCEPCLLGRMGLVGSLFLKLDCALDERTRSRWEGAASSVKLQEEPSGAGSPSKPPSVIDNRRTLNPCTSDFIPRHHRVLTLSSLLFAGSSAHRGKERSQARGRQKSKGI